MIDRIERFRPVELSKAWAVMEEEVRRIVARADPGSPELAQELLLVTARLAVFAHNDGYPPQAPVLLARELIDRFVTVGCGNLSKGTRDRYTRQLTKLREAVLQGRDHRIPAQTLWEISPWRPYSPEQMRDLWWWARGQRTELLRQGCKMLMCLGYGCGLLPPAIVDVRMRDVLRSGDRAHLEVVVQGEAYRPPAVCLESWEDHLLAELPKNAEPGSPVFRPGSATRTVSLVSGLLARADLSPDTPTLQLSRLHATWFVGRIDARVPLDVIFAQAGPHTRRTLDRVTPYLTATDPDEAARLLRTPANLSIPGPRAAEPDRVIELCGRDQGGRLG
ncbi:MAG: hypothetical protein ABIS86_21755 [Streptosporangiaceae bacterium]